MKFYKYRIDNDNFIFDEDYLVHNVNFIHLTRKKIYENIHTNYIFNEDNYINIFQMIDQKKSLIYELNIIIYQKE
jgi:hypothetical protein